MVVDPIGKAKNFSRIENIPRIERLLDLALDVEQRVAELIAHVFSAGDADAMLGRKRAFELANQRGGLIGHQPEFSQIFGGMKIKRRPNMEQSAGGMAVIARFEAER